MSCRIARLASVLASALLVPVLADPARAQLIAQSEGAGRHANDAWYRMGELLTNLVRPSHPGPSGEPERRPDGEPQSQASPRLPPPSNPVRSFRK